MLFINLPSFNNLRAKEIESNTVHTLWKHVNNVGTYGGHLVKQFVRSLNGNAFDWYTNLEPNSINSLEQLEHEFLNRFYSKAYSDYGRAHEYSSNKG